ncbi:keratin-associated protein 24-1 [Ochotona princeps]|uniref:keratin-associated protein 24-1 n=1 Tax=Ochotona princeps TaxID=9978 RepID=UPI002714A78F|nr:keratin-associated protein 24-1 [Ochotona princeps]
MPFLGHSATCGASSYHAHCYIPVTSAALSSNEVSPAFGLCLPSSCQGNLWLLDHCQESYCEAPSCNSPSCEPTPCAASCDLSNSRGSCNPPSAGPVITACEITNSKPSPSCNPGINAKGYVSSCDTRAPCASKACQTLHHDSTCFGQFSCSHKSLQPRNYCRLGNLGFRSYQNLGFIPSGFSPSCTIASSYQPQCYLTSKCRYPSYGFTSCRPLNYSFGNFRSLSCIPSTFPPLRYLCSGSRPLSCY